MHNINDKKIGIELMDIKEAGNKYLKPVVSLIKGEHNKQTFEKYLYGLMLVSS